jgi:hypothetical protein
LDILVIGDDGHSRATCVHWMGTWPNIEEFDLVIVAQNTMTQEIFDQIPHRLEEIRSQILTVFMNGRSVWCIIEKMLLPSPPKTGPKGFRGSASPPSSYDWLFVYPTIKQVAEGSSIRVVDETFAPYLQKVRKWSLEIQNVYTHQRQFGSIEPVEVDGLALEPIAQNKSGKAIGARLVGVDLEFYGGSGSICFLPKPTECDTHEAIETLLDIATGQERVEPEWRAKVEIPGLGVVEKEVEDLKLAYEKRMSELKLKWLSLDRYRDVFSIHETPQVDAVRTILGDLGIKTERTKPGFPVDLLGKEIAVEVTSIAGKVDSDSPKMFQLTQFYEKHRRDEKVLLVANTYKREDPLMRRGRQDFTPPVLDFLRLKGICALTSVTLLDLWNLGKTDPKKAREMLLNAVGELKI